MKPHFIMMGGLTFRNLEYADTNLATFLRSAHIASLIPPAIATPRMQLACMLNGVLPHDVESEGTRIEVEGWVNDDSVDLDGAGCFYYMEQMAREGWPLVVCGLTKASKENHRVPMPTIFERYPTLTLKNWGSYLEVDGDSESLQELRRLLPELPEVDSAYLGHEREMLGMCSAQYAELLVVMQTGLAVEGASYEVPVRPLHPLDYPVLAVDRRLIREPLKQEYAGCEIRLLLGSLIAE